jgi:hypothetical protein
MGLRPMPVHGGFNDARSYCRHLKIAGLDHFQLPLFEERLGDAWQLVADPSFLFLCANKFFVLVEQAGGLFEAIDVISANRVLGVRKAVEVGTSIVKRD